MRIVAVQIVEDDRNDRGLGVQPPFKVVAAVCCPSVSSCNMAVITHRVIHERFVTHVARISGAEGQPVLSCHPHGLWIG